jgi:hypothetical protein
MTTKELTKDILAGVLYIGLIVGVAFWLYTRPQVKANNTKQINTGSNRS